MPSDQFAFMHCVIIVCNTVFYNIEAVTLKYIFDIINFDNDDNLDQIISDVIIQLKSKEIL